MAATLPDLSSEFKGEKGKGANEGLKGIHAPL